MRRIFDHNVCFATYWTIYLYFSDFKSVPPSLLRVKLWYDDSFLDHGEIKSHDNALQYIKDTMALVYPSTCLSSLGTRLELEVSIISVLVNCLLFIKNIFFGFWIISVSCRNFEFCHIMRKPIHFAVGRYSTFAWVFHLGRAWPTNCKI